MGTEQHLPAGLLSCPGVSESLPSATGGSLNDQGAFPYEREAESLKHVCVYLYIDIHVHAHVFCRRNSGRFFPYLKHLFPSCTLPLLPLGITVSLMACLLQAVLYDFWGRVSCTLPMFEEEAASTTSSLNNDSNHFQQTISSWLAIVFSQTLQPM